MEKKIKVSNRMEARLSGYQFKITAITPEIQAVSQQQITSWSWEVIPKKEGDHNLHLTISALLVFFIIRLIGLISV